MAARWALKRKFYLTLALDGLLVTVCGLRMLPPPQMCVAAKGHTCFRSRK
jgi:hypothetical protein